MNMASNQAEEPMDRGALAALYEETFRNFEEGTIIEGRVVTISKDKVVIDIGYKSEGMIAIDEFSSEELQHLKVDDRLPVYIEEREDSEGNLVLSKEKADKMKVWDEISGACERDELIEGTISQRVKGGLSVTIKGGVKAFLPGSQVDRRPIGNGMDNFKCVAALQNQAIQQLVI
jgi:small subunit ribosomal protein S1